MVSFRRRCFRLTLRDGFLMELESIGETPGGFCGRSQQGFGKTPGLLNRVVASYDFLGSIPDTGDDERGKR